MDEALDLSTRPVGTTGQPPTAPPGGGFTPTRGRGLPSTLFASLALGCFLGPTAAQALTFDVEGPIAYVEGEIDTRDLRRFQLLLKRNPQLETLVLVDVPGSNDDETNAQIIRLIRARGLNTHLAADSLVASGGTDLFLAGKRRTMEPGAQVGVHSWADGPREGRDFAKSDPAHKLFLDLYRDLGILADFYWFTLEAAPADDLHFMTEAEILRFGMLTAPMGEAP